MSQSVKVIEKNKNLTPQEIVKILDEHIVGQKDAKQAAGNALRNRTRRTLVDESIRNEITPKNILMIGPTGVGKTEIARRLAKLANAPFIKVEATKFTEVGFVGRDVDSIIRDLMKESISLVRKQAIDRVQETAKNAAENRILDALAPKAKSSSANKETTNLDNIVDFDGNTQTATTSTSDSDDNATRQLFRKKLREGELDDKEIELELSQNPIGVEIMAPPGMEEMTGQIQNIFQSISGERKKLRKMKIKDAFKIAQEEEAAKLINEDEIKAEAIESAEQHGIVFIDEIDKVTSRSNSGSSSGADVSREGVQRDLLPLIEGCTVSTKYGTIKTDHILFVTSGAFHTSKPSDLIPELQGRLPIRVELKALSVEDFVRILTEPFASLTDQYIALLKTEEVELKFSQDGITRIAEIAWEVNEKSENIGARRLHTVMEKLLDDVSFRATEFKGKTVNIDKKYVNSQLAELAKDEDLSRFIL